MAWWTFEFKISSCLCFMLNMNLRFRAVRMKRESTLLPCERSNETTRSYFMAHVSKWPCSAKSIKWLWLRQLLSTHRIRSTDPHSLDHLRKHTITSLLYKTILQHNLHIKTWLPRSVPQLPPVTVPTLLGQRNLNLGYGSQSAGEW